MINVEFALLYFSGFAHDIAVAVFAADCAHTVLFC
jgi:hypothetical protein